MGSKKTTNVTNETGLGDDQFTTLSEGQEGISGQVTDLSTNIDTRFDTVDDTLDSGFQGVGDQLDTVGDTLGTLGTDMSTGFGNVQADISGLGTDMTKAFEGQAETINTGFDTLGTQVGNEASAITANVDTRTGELSDQIGQGFTDASTAMNTGFTDLTDVVTTGNTALGDQLTATGDALGQQAEAGFNAVTTNLDDAKAAIIAGQGDMTTLIEQYGGNLDAYATSLLEGQAAAQEQVGTLQTGLDEFASQYADDYTLAAQQRNELQQGIQGGFNQAAEQAGQIANAAATERMNLSQGLTDLGAGQSAIGDTIGSGFRGVGQAIRDSEGNIVGQTVQSAQNVDTAIRDAQGNVLAETANYVQDAEGNIIGVQNKTFTRIAKELAVGFDDGSQESLAAKTDFNNRLNGIKNVLNTQGDQLSDNLRDSYTKLSNSFDEQGKLIANSTDSFGNRISRAIDAQGNLLIATFNETGGKLDQQSLSINQMMGQMEQFGYRPGSNINMGTLSPASRRAEAAYVQSGRGLMTPFTRTREVA